MPTFLDVLHELELHYDDDLGTNRLCNTYKLLANTYAGGQILEIGSWPGDFAVALKRLGYDIHGVDIDPSRAADLFRREGVNVQRCDIESDPLPFHDGQFSYIVFTEVIEHLYRNPLHALRELRRVLAPSGQLLLSTPNFTCWRHRLAFCLNEPLPMLESPLEAFSKRERVGHMGHLRLFTPQELREMLQYAGFHVTYEEYQDLNRPSPRKPSSKTARPVAATPPAPSLARRLLRRRAAWEYVEAIGLRLGPFIQQRVPRLRSHQFVIAALQG